MGPSLPGRPSDERIASILRGAKTIAVVGLSSDEGRPSNRVARYLQDEGYRILPVNPNETKVLGEPAFPSLLDVPEPVDIVDVFRRPEHTPAIATDSVRIGAKVLWLQVGIVSDEARRIAIEGGMDVVMDLCLLVEHQRMEVG